MFTRAAIVGSLLLTAVPAFAQNTNTPLVDKREANQEARINQGVQSGALTTREAKTLDARENKLATNEAAAKADGNVTPAERAKLRGEARRTNRAIARKKHNDRTTSPSGQ